MIYLINYADSAFKNAQHYSTKKAYSYGKVDKVIEYGPKDIEKNFHDENKEIFSIKRGAGLWLWKPYICLKTINEINDGDYLVYLDSGAVLINDIRNLIKLMKSDFYVSRLPLFEYNYTSKNVLEYFNDSGNSQQILATFFIFKKSKATIKFLNNWLELCRDIDLLQGNNKGEKLISHREDQSIFSLLVKKNNIESHTDPSQFGFFPSKYILQSDFHSYVNEKYNENDKIIIFCHRQKKISFYLKIKTLIYKFYPRFLLFKELC